MTRLVGEHFTREGRPKKAYRDQRAALYQAARNTTIYRCTLCGAWHRATERRAA